MRSSAVALAVVSALAWPRVFALGQSSPGNEDESKVGAYTLPDPLVARDGTRIADPEAWRRKRRPEILELFASQVYGRTPSKSANVRSVTTGEDPRALGGLATRREVSLYFAPGKDATRMDLLIYVPNGAKGRVPAFLGLNFLGNECVHPDPGIAITKQWVRAVPNRGIVDNRATELTRGVLASTWQVEKVLARGYALVTAYHGDLEPDFAGGLELGIRPLFYRPGQTAPDADEWGAIGAWAWGLSRALDYLQGDVSIDAGRVALIGHSRLGKTALWAAAQDERFSLVIANDSGEGGAALARRNYGETVEHLNTSFPHWFCANFKEYNKRPNTLPVDQHMLIALLAPRPVYVASAADDKWADPRGEFLGAKHAELVYALFGLRGLGKDDMPPPNTPVGETLGYHVRSGGHDVTDYDWEQFLRFADRHLGSR